MPAIIRIEELEKRIGVRKSSIYALIRRGEFPAPVQLLDRASGWLDSDIDAWLKSRPRGVRTWGKAAKRNAE